MKATFESIKETQNRLKLARLKYIAVQRGFGTLKELAASCGVTYRHLHFVVTGKRESQKLKKKLILLLGPEVQKLFEEDVWLSPSPISRKPPSGRR